MDGALLVGLLDSYRVGIGFGRQIAAAFTRRKRSCYLQRKPQANGEIFDLKPKDILYTFIERR